MWAPEVVCRNAIILLFVTQFPVCKGERGDGDQRSGAGDSDRVDTLTHLTSALSQQNSLAANKSYINLSQSSNTLDTQGNIDKTATTCFLLTCINCNNLIWWTLDTCEAHTADCDSAATKLVQVSSSPGPELVPSLQQNQTLLIAIPQTWYVPGNNPCSDKKHLLISDRISDAKIHR